MSGRMPSAAELVQWARLHNGVCPKCGTVNDFNGKARCLCILDTPADLDSSTVESANSVPGSGVSRG